MKLSDAAEEILETLWISQEEKGIKEIDLGKLVSENRDLAISELKNIGYVSVENGKIKLLDKGKEYARNTVRRHRLAERIMTDVLQLKMDLMDKTACQFEHMLQPELEESICILLGHPKVCPHGKPIPPGNCCVESKWIVEASIKPLTALKVGERGKVAYIHTHNDKKLQKLMAMGVLPGMPISLLHKIPSYVFQIGHTQVAVDNEMASDIYVRIQR
ncbi:MAG: metal-dependent transcriptional regulator [Candidatus Omnitrophica bacterium]|nr:metal-dependent transcriptional regulator [Candidatus Omnitrophota bacterium]